MDALKFIKEAKRMCQSYEECEACPADARGNFVDCRVDIMQDIDVADAVAIVEEWSAAHPHKTRQSTFLEHYPEARLDEYGVLRFCPSDISAAHRYSVGCGYTEQRCTDCRREFWMQEVE